MKYRASGAAPTDAGEDENLQAVLRDIESSLSDLDRRLADAAPRQTPQTAPQPRPREGIGDPATPACPESATTSPACTKAEADSEASDLLAEMEREAAAKARGANDHLAAFGPRISGALQRIFEFLHPFCQYANTLRPQIARPYRLDSSAIFADLQWQEAYADRRRQDLREKALIDHVSFNLRLAAPKPVTVVRRWDGLASLRNEIHLLNLRSLEEMELNDKPLQEYVAVRLAPDFPVQLNFRGDYEEGRIEILGRNFEGFSISAFVVAPEQVDRVFLDGLGRYLLGQTNALPPAMTHIHYVPNPR